MKKLLALFLLCTILPLSSCSDNIYELPEDTSPPETSAPNPYNINGTDFEYTLGNDPLTNISSFLTSVFGLRCYDNYIYMSGRYIYRYNPKTGNVTHVCADPLCMHNNDDCPFYGFLDGTFKIHDNKVYYYRFYYPNGRETGESVYQQVCYDIETHTLTALRELPHGEHLLNEYFTDQYHYYMELQTNENDEQITLLFQRDLDTGKVKTIKQFDNTYIGYLLYADDERIYCTDGANYYYFTLDNPDEYVYILKGKIANFSCNGENFYAVIDPDPTDDDSFKQLYRFDMEGNNLTQLTPDEHNIQFFCTTEKYIYYKIYSYITISGGSRIDTGDIYRIPLEGGEPELIDPLPEDMKDYTISHFFVDGNYLYGSYQYYNPETEEYADSTGMLPYCYIRVNLTTGELYYITE